MIRLKTKFTVGEMAKIHNVSAQTLRYYDKIGLLKPEYVDKNNSYRYYGIDQFALLDAVVFLRSLGLSINDIKSYINDRKLNSFLNILELQKKTISMEIKRLKVLEKGIDIKLDSIKDSMNKAWNPKVEILPKDDRYILYVNLEKQLNNVEFEYSLLELGELIKDENLMFQGVITLGMKKEDFIEGKYQSFSTMALLFDKNLFLQNKVLKIPSGLFATLTYFGSYEMGEEHFKQLHEEIDKKGYVPSGDILILNVAEAAFSEVKKEFITEIQIPIKKKS